MADEPPHLERQMSLVPYTQDAREVVLRHGSAVVVYDEKSRQLSLKQTPRSHSVELADCPYCHRPLRSDSQSSDHTEHVVSPDAENDFTNPEYFRLLHHSTPGSPSSSRPPSPVRRLVQPGPRSGSSGTSGSRGPPSGAEFIGSSPASPPAPQGISSSAFSPDYFSRFFIEERVLGRGGKGVVLLVKHVLDGVSLGYFACKRVPVGDDHDWLEKVLVEVQLLQNLQHNNLVSYRHVWLEDYHINTFGPSVPCAFILQQYCNAGDLHSYILSSVQTTTTTEQLKDRLRRRSKGQMEPPQKPNAPRRMQFEEIFSFFRDITSGLHHLHANGYIHRDLKPSNCLLHRTGNSVKVLVSDFGEVQAVNAARRSTGATGTISYCAPEVLRKNAADGAFGNFTTKSDIFSLGMIVYFMCFGRLPYSNADDINEENEDLEQLRQEITAWIGFDDERRIRGDLPEKLYRFLKILLSLDPTSRPSTEDILQGIKASSGFEDPGITSSQSMFGDARSRISPADSPVPKSVGQRHVRRPSSSGLTRPGLLSLRHNTSGEAVRPQSPVRASQARVESPTGSLESSVILRTRKVDLPPPSPGRRSPTPSQIPRLMLPPPPTASGRLQVLVHNLAGNVVFRVVLFLFKLATLTYPCSPYAASQWISFPLLCAAALDLGLPRFSWKTSFLLLCLHLAIVSTAFRWELLCFSKN
ncbi:putative serine/threonine-protein kinase iks1 [Elasticomyces elasticus]|nr:putative serine/threonine-protein kinase iks1 [Elasticomyces elasticus]KAK4996405.1 putative serine/threonine-protein kinase iks1 [Elasticomyces elasticus]